jgi:hypothetical protein
MRPSTWPISSTPWRNAPTRDLINSGESSPRNSMIGDAGSSARDLRPGRCRSKERDEIAPPYHEQSLTASSRSRIEAGSV